MSGTVPGTLSGQTIVAGAVFVAARTDRFRILPQLNVKLDFASRSVFAPSGFAVDKGLVFLNRVQDSLELHSGVPFFETSVVR